MKVSLALPESPRLEISIILAAHSAISTYILQHENTRDLSRLGLLSCSMKWHRAELASPIMASIDLIATKQDEAGTRFFFESKLSTQENEPFAQVDFEILERKRGVKSSVLKGFGSSVESGEACEVRSWSYDEFCSHFQLHSRDTDSGLWPIEHLLLLLLSHGGPHDRYSFQYHAKGVAELGESVCVFSSNGADSNPSLLQIVQGSCLIGQLN